MRTSYQPQPDGTVRVVNVEVPVLGIADLVIDRANGMVYPLTTCCGASAKGSGSGVVCRGCYVQIPDTWGIAWALEQAAVVIDCPDCHDTLNGCPYSPLRDLIDMREAWA